MKNATIRGVAAKQDRNQNNAVQLDLEIDGETGPGRWVREWIGPNAPDFIVDRWVAVLGTSPIVAMSSGTPWDMIGIRVALELKEEEYNGRTQQKIAKVEAITSVEPAATAAEPAPESGAESGSGGDDLPF